MKHLLFILFFSFVTYFSYGQTTFTQTFVDRCTGDVQIVTANFVQGSAVIAFYDEVKIFTYQQFINGELQSWLIQKYSWWQALSPCSQATQQAQQAQQAAQTASTASSTASTTTNNASTTSTNTNTSNGSSNTDSSNSSEPPSSGNSSGSSEGESSGGGETSPEPEQTETENNEPKSEESTEEEPNPTEETESEEEESDDSEDSEKSDDTESEGEKEKRKMMPIQLKADLMGQQSLLGNYNSVINFGASQSSIFGDVNYAANLMIWDNLKQFGLSLNRTKVTLNDNYTASWVDAVSVSYMRNFNVNAISGSLSRMKPLGRWGTVGVGINYAYIFGKDTFGDKVPDMYSLGWNVLYTNIFRLTNGITYTPAIIGAQNPLSYTRQLTDVVDNSSSNISKDFIGILANTFNVQLTKRFSFNVGWTVIYSTNEFVPIMNSFMIGSKLPF